MPNQYRLKYDPAVISHLSPSRIESMFTEKEIRAAYNKFRNEYRKRRSEIQASDYADSPVFQDADEVFLPTGRNMGPVARIHALQEITRFLQSKESSLAGLKEADDRRIRNLQDKGLDIIKTPQDLRNFGQFMKSVKPYFDKMKYDSDQAATLYEYAIMDNISLDNIKKHYSFYVENLEEIGERDLSIKRGQHKGERRKKAWTAKQLAKELGVPYDEQETMY